MPNRNQQLASSRSRLLLTALLALTTLGAGKLEITLTAKSHKDSKPPRRNEYGVEPAQPYNSERVDYKNLDGIIVWAEPIGDTPKPTTPPPAPTIEVKPLALGEQPRIVASAIGAEIHLKNTSDAAQAVFSMSEGNTFRVESIAPGAESTVTAKAAGLVEILIESSDDPVALVYIAPSPLVTTAKSGTKVEFKDLAPGQYKVTTWHRRLPGVETTVKVDDKKTAKVEASVGVRDAALPKM